MKDKIVVSWSYHFILSRSWHSFDTASPHLTDKGVYIIFYYDVPNKNAVTVVYVGQSDRIKGRLEEHRLDRKIIKHNKHPGKLKITWTWALSSLTPDETDGIERYLANMCGPIEGGGWPDVEEIPVNLPWGPEIVLNFDSNK